MSAWRIFSDADRDKHHLKIRLARLVNANIIMPVNIPSPALTTNERRKGLTTPRSDILLSGHALLGGVHTTRGYGRGVAWRKIASQPHYFYLFNLTVFLNTRLFLFKKLIAS